MKSRNNILKTTYAQVEPYVTKDSSTIRELMHPTVHGNLHLSLAEARVPPGGATLLHVHESTEEVYHITAGCGIMTLAKEQFEVNCGDTVCIPPGTAHKVENISDMELVILCCCAPAYSHEDTSLLENIAR